MKTCVLFALSLFFTLANVNGQSQSNSILKTGKFFKLSIPEHGVYKIDYTTLSKTGIDPTKADPRKIKIYGNTGGMLPQPNSVSRPQDLSEMAIFVRGEADGRFDPDDYILFYAEGPDRSDYQLSREIFRFENNIYSDANFSFITLAETQGKRIQISENLAGNHAIINTYQDFIFHENDERNLLDHLDDNGSGREWFGERFGIQNDHRFTFDIEGIVPGSNISVVSDVLGTTYKSASLKLFWNDTEILKQDFSIITIAPYGIKGHNRRDTVEFSESIVNGSDTDQQHIHFQFLKASGFSEAFLNYFLLSFERSLQLYGNKTIFSNAESTFQTTSTFEVSRAGDIQSIWDITDPTNPKAQEFSVTDNVARFSTETALLKKFIAYSSNIPSPGLVGAVANQNLHGLASTNLIIVTHPDFRLEAERLADHRRSFSNWTVSVVDIYNIYNEFSSGRQDVSAIRDFVKYQYDKAPGVVQSLLLFGKASFDYKDRLFQNKNFIPIYESRNSIHPLQTYSSDDYYAFLEDFEGEWRETTFTDHTLDIGVGRLPVSNPEEARNIVDKIIDYDTDKKTFGYWRKEIVFVADDGSTTDGFTELHQSHADDVAALVQQLHPALDTKKLFMGVYPKEVMPGDETVPAMNIDIRNAIKKGALIVNFTGHGNERKWTDEDVFNKTDIAEIDNKLLPFFVTATCEFGRHDNPSDISGAELLLTRKNAGAIGLVTTTRPVNAGSNFELNLAFYEALLTRVDGKYPNIGEVYRQTKNNSSVGVGNRNFSLLGDPSMTLKIPSNVARVTSIQTANGSDTLKALSHVFVTGQIENADGLKINDFNGRIAATLFDKKVQFVTTGRNPTPFTFSQWHNTLYRGNATVKNGMFSFEFIVPKNIAYTLSSGRFSLYASDAAHHLDANGVSTDFTIGGTETNYAADNTPPKINAFIGDSTFTNGGVALPNTWLVARLSDESGINISDYGIGNSLTAVIDEGFQTFSLNEFYTADLDDYRSGMIHYPLNNLAPGRHTLTLKAWDIQNNGASATLHFFVTDGNELVIENFGSYPNPLTDKTTFFFSHNRSGDDLEAQLFIYSHTGQMIKSFQVPLSATPVNVDLMEWTAEEKSEKLPAGIYLARLFVRSLSNGSKNEQVTKLVIVN